MKKTAIILHLHYQDLWEEFKLKLTPLLCETTDLYVTVGDGSTQYYQDIIKLAKQIFVVPNKGMDVAPFIYVYSKIKDMNYSYFIKLHSKKSLHTPGVGDTWRKSLYYPLVENYSFIQQSVENSEGPWMVGVGSYYHDMLVEPRNHPNKLAAKKYIDKVCTLLKVKDEGSFFAGTMFIVNDIYLNVLFEKINLEDFYNLFEEGYLRDSLAHGMERVLGYGISHHNGTYYTI